MRRNARSGEGVRSRGFSQVLAFVVVASAIAMNAPGQGAPPATKPAPPPTARAATKADLQISVSLQAPAAAGGQAMAVATLRNMAKEPVRLYRPGFAGPIFHPLAGDDVPNVALESATGADAEYMILRPGEEFSRTRAVPATPMRCDSYFMFYMAGWDGVARAVTAVVYSTNAITTPAPK